ncbi:phage portal protein [Clostridium beijerinckii]|uniref:Phage portal protein n=1 Tax=Clostridium beijerinckii TaxID=1520 RepID=A0A0B5QKU6_CLOBE|nr:terminase small subunit [Clostridium beijerinckii]AJG98856.1 phage portal protein [Clostridium beijerinckii]
MARQRSPNRDKALEIYKEHKGNITNREIASILNEDEKKIAVWKQRDKWDNDSNVVQQKNKCCTTNKNTSKKTKKNSNQEPIADEIKEVLENTKLNDKQRLFCVIYAKRMNATKAYQQAYHCSYETAMVNGCNLLRNPKIKEQVDRLTALELNKEFLSRGVIQKYIDIAFADITDYVQFGQDYYVVKDKEGHPMLDDEGNVITKPYNYVRLGESNQVDGTLISEISEGKDGVKIKLADKMKALDFLTKHCNLLSDEERIKLDIENKKLQNAKLGVEIERLKGNKNTNKDVVQIVDDIDD